MEDEKQLNKLVEKIKNNETIKNEEIIELFKTTNVDDSNSFWIKILILLLFWRRNDKEEILGDD